MKIHAIKKAERNAKNISFFYDLIEYHKKWVAIAHKFMNTFCHKLMQ